MKTIAIMACLLFISNASAQLDLTGTWDWTQTVNADNTVTTPADLGYTIQYEFAADGLFHYYQDDVLVDSGTYLVQIVELYGNPADHLTINGTPGQGVGFPIVEGDMLYWMMGLDDFGHPTCPCRHFQMRPVATESSTWSEVKALFR